MTIDVYTEKRRNVFRNSFSFAINVRFVYVIISIESLSCKTPSPEKGGGAGLRDSEYRSTGGGG